MSEKIYRTTVPIYGTLLRLVVTDDVKGFAQKNCADNSEPVALTAWVKGVLHIVIPQGKKTIGVVAHEVVHAAAEVLDHHGAKWNKFNQEPLCYLVGWMMDWINRVVK